MAEPIIVSYSELDTFRQCPLKHMLAYGQRWTKPVKPDSALDKGSRYHKVMEAVFHVIKAYQDANGGKNPKEGSAAEEMLLNACRAAARKILWDDQAGAYYDDVAELIDWMLDGWLKHFGTMPAWRIMGIEHQIITPLRDEKGRRTRYHLKAKIDLIVKSRETGKLWVVDHKSGQNLPTQMELEIDDQFGLYTWALREVGKKIAGSIHAANRTQRNKSPQTLESRMALTYLGRDQIEVTNLALDAYFAARAAHPPSSMERARYSSPDPRSCGWKCDFKEPHLIMRRGRKVAEVMTEYGFKIDRTRH